MNNQMKGITDLRQFGYGDPNIKIAVLDGFLDIDHPCFNKENGKLIPFSFDVKPSSSNDLALRHGTAVCSLIFGKPGSIVEGVSPGCSGLIMSIYAQDEHGNFLSASQVLLAKAIELAIEQKANIINISGGQFSRTGEPDSFLKSAIEKCHEKGILIVAASGNEGCNCLHLPAAHRLVLAVGSMDENGEPTQETNYGELYKLNGILSPGKGLTAALPGGGTFITNGATSYATPIVTGVIALLMSLQIKNGHPPNAYAIRRLLEKTAIPCMPGQTNDCKRFMQGKLNIPGIIEVINNDPGILSEGHPYLKSEKIIAMTPNYLNESSEKILHKNEEAVLMPSCENINNEMQANGIQNENTAEVINSKPLQNEEIVLPSSASELTNSINNLPETSSGRAITNFQNDNILKPLLNNSLKKENMENLNTGLTENVINSNATDQQLFVSPSGEIDPSDCGCGGGKSAPPAIVYALGTIGYDFGSESHRDSFVQSMGDDQNPHNPAELIAYLKKNPWDAAEILWTLNIDATPIYAIHPSGPYSNVLYERIISGLEEQQNGNVQRISVPGLAEGTTSLLNGQTVTNLYPNLRGMYSWTTSALVASTAAGEKGASKILAENVTNFLNRIYYKMRNLGVSAEDRALNYSATNAYQVSAVFSSALKENLELDDIVALKSPICRPGSDCYDVVLTFFNPKERLTQAKKEFRFTIDVSDVVPVTVGEVRSWSVF